MQEGEDALLPAWFIQMGEKGQNDSMQNQIIIAQLEIVLYDDAEIPATASLFTMIRNRKPQVALR